MGLLAAAVVLLVGGLTGCDSSDPVPPAQGSFSAALTGADPASFQEWAVFDDDIDNIDLETTSEPSATR